MTIWWHDGHGYSDGGQDLGPMSLSEAGILAADYGTEIGDLVFVRIGRPPVR